MRVAIAGAGGFVGRSLVTAAMRRGWSVTGVSRPGTAASAGGPRHVEADLAAGGPIALGGPHDAAVFLAQSQAHRRGPEGWPDLFAIGVSGLARFADAARRAGVRRFVFASTGTIYRPSFAPLAEDAPLRRGDPYAASKHMGEELIELFEADFRTTCARLFAVYGPGQRQRLVPDVVERVATGRAVELEPASRGDADPCGLTISTLHVADAAEVLCALVEGDAPGALNVASPEAVSVRALAEQAGALLGRAPRFEISARTRSGDLVADTGRLERLLAPKFRLLADGLREVVEARRAIGV